MAGGRRLGDAQHRAVVDARIVVGDPHQEAGDAQPHQRAEVEIEAGRPSGRIAVDRAQAQHQGRDREQQHPGDHGRAPKALVEGAHDAVAGAQLHEIGARDRGQEAHGADHQREQHQRAGLRAGEEDRPQQHGRDEGDGVGFEQVGRHAGAVADIVADIVRDHGGVAGIVLGNAGLDLADQVGAHVRPLGEDAAAETGEDRDQGRAERQADQRLQDRALIGAERQQDAVVEGDAEQAQGDNEHAGDRPGLERDVEPTGEAAGRGGLGCAGVRAHRDVHADEAGCGGQAGADGVADADLEPEEEGEEHEDDHANHGDGCVLAAEVGGGTLLDGRRDLLHPLVAGGHCEDAGARANRPDDARGAAGEHQHVEKPLQTRHGHLPLLVARQDQLWRARESALHTLSSSLLGPRPAPL